MSLGVSKGSRPGPEKGALSPIPGRMPDMPLLTGV